MSSDRSAQHSGGAAGSRRAVPLSAQRRAAQPLRPPSCPGLAPRAALPPPALPTGPGPPPSPVLPPAAVRRLAVPAGAGGGSGRGSGRGAVTWPCESRVAPTRPGRDPKVSRFAPAECPRRDGAAVPSSPCPKKLPSPRRANRGQTFCCYLSFVRGRRVPHVPPPTPASLQVPYAGLRLFFPSVLLLVCPPACLLLIFPASDFSPSQRRYKEKYSPGLQLYKYSSERELKSLEREKGRRQRPETKAGAAPRAGSAGPRHGALAQYRVAGSFGGRVAAGGGSAHAVLVLN